MNDERGNGHSKAAGGAKPSARVFQKWSRAPYWSAQDGVNLAFGLDPDEINRVGPHEPTRFASPARMRFVEIAWNAVSNGDLKEETTPSQFMEWAKGVGLIFHEIWKSPHDPRIPAGPDGELETVGETVERISKSIERRDELIAIWALSPTWTWQEGACLAHNVSPKLLSWDGKLPRKFPGADRVYRLIEFSKRAYEQHQIEKKLSPAEFIAWSESVGFRFDPKWHQVVGAPCVAKEPVLRQIRDAPPERVIPPAQSIPRVLPEKEPGKRSHQAPLSEAEQGFLARHFHRCAGSDGKGPA